MSPETVVGIKCSIEKKKRQKLTSVALKYICNIESKLIKMNKEIDKYLKDEKRKIRSKYILIKLIKLNN